MTVGLTTIQIHLSAPRSLKEKRMVLNRLKTALRSRFENLAIAEIEYQDKWQRATLALVTVAADRVPVENLLRAAATEVENTLPGEVLDVANEFLT